MTMRKQSGVAALEFVLIAPLFFLVLIGSLLLGFAFYLHSQVQAAAWDGVQSVLQMDRSTYDLPSDCANFQSAAKTRAEQAVKNSLTAGPKILRESTLATAGTGITVDVCSSDQIKVTASYNYKGESGLPTYGFLNKISGSASASYW